MTAYIAPLICHKCGASGDMPRGPQAVAAGWQPGHGGGAPRWTCHACAEEERRRSRERARDISPPRVPLLALVALALSTSEKP